MALFPLLKLSSSFIALYTSPRGAYKILNQKIKLTIDSEPNLILYIMFAVIVSVENNPNMLSHKDKTAPLD